MKVLVGIPAGRLIETETATSLIGMKRNCRLGVFAPIGYSVDTARNLVVEHALEIGYDYILWIDSDIIVPKDILTKLLAHKEDIVSGVYSYKVIGATEAVAKKYGPDGIYLDLQLDDVRAMKGLQEIDAVGFGCILTSTEVFKKMKPPYFIYDDDMGEDVYFCKNAQALGYKVWLDPAIKCGHIGSVVYNV